MAKNGKKKAAQTLYVPPTIEHADWDETAERVPLFSITTPDPDGGEPTVTHYDMPAKPHPGLALRFLRDARIYGAEVAAAALLEESVGTEGYLALCAEPDLAPSDLSAIMLRARNVVLGRLEAPKD